MARSLRSHTKKRTRGKAFSAGTLQGDRFINQDVHIAIKREKIFGPVEDARTERLAQAQAEAAKKPSVGDFMEEDKTAETNKVEEDNAMTEEEPKKKISTSGPRSNRHARKLKEKKKKGKKGFAKF